MNYQINLELEKQEIIFRYEDMLKYCYLNLSPYDFFLIRKAFDFAKKAHENQRRNTGEPYIYHPIAVAKIICQEIGLDSISIAAALLHDIVEDTKCTLKDIENSFGKKMATIISGLTKISSIDSEDINIQSENFKKLLITLSEDIRVILIKIADRLHNMRTLEIMDVDKQKKNASETIYIYAPLAHRMGLYLIKSELEDLSLQYNDPENYNYVKKKILPFKKKETFYIKEFNELISKKLYEENIKYIIKGRTKSISSIVKKIKIQNISFDEIYDLFAIRIIYKSDQKNEKFLAWKIYAIITDLFHPNSNRIRDWISHPKSNGYESLHVTVVGPRGKWIEIQIRSERMDEVAEKGIAAHYKYKEGCSEEDNQIEIWIKQIRELLSHQNNQSTQELLDNFKLNLYTSEIFIFTPKGDVKILPNGASVLDFAYILHTLIGESSLGAKVNGKLVPLSYRLYTGDQVEIITSEHQKPKSNWLKFVITSYARSKIQSALNIEKKNISEKGKNILIKELKYYKIIFNESESEKILKFFKLNSCQDLFYETGIGKIDSTEIKKYIESKNFILNFFKKFKTKLKKINIYYNNINKNVNLLVFGIEEKKLDYIFANCCSPISGDRVFGFISINQGIKVHKEDCLNSIDMRAKYNYRIIKAKWIDNFSIDYRVMILITGIDIIGIINKITDVFLYQAINILSVNSISNNGIFEGRWVFQIKNKTELDKVIQKLKKIKGIKKVNRLK